MDPSSASVLLRRYRVHAECVVLDRASGGVRAVETASIGQERGVFDVVGGMWIAVYRAGGDLFVRVDALELPIGTLDARLWRGWVRSRLLLRRGSDVIADVRYPGRWTHIPHRMDALAYQDDELDFGRFLARRINERARHGMFPGAAASTLESPGSLSID